MSELPDFVIEQELDRIITYCSDCGDYHGPQACIYEEEHEYFDER